MANRSVIAIFLLLYNVIHIKYIVKIHTYYKYMKISSETEFKLHLILVKIKSQTLFFLVGQETIILKSSFEDFFWINASVKISSSNSLLHVSLFILFLQENKTNISSTSQPLWSNTHNFVWAFLPFCSSL